MKTQKIHDNLIKWQEYMFFLIIVTLPFYNIPLRYTLLPATALGHCLAFYPAVIGIGLWCLEKSSLKCLKRNFVLWQWSCLYFLWGALSVFFTAFFFPYYEQYSLQDLSRLGEIIKGFLLLFGLESTIYIKIGVNFSLSMVHWVVDSFFFIVPMFWIYSLFHGRLRRGVAICACGMIAWHIYLIPWALLEYGYLQGSDWAGEALAKITSLVFDCARTGVYPPLLWHGQMRFVFLEPSGIGHYACFAIPIFIGIFFWKKWISYLGCIFWIMGIFFAHARTGYMVLVLIIVGLSLWGILYRSQGFLKEICCLLSSFVLAFGLYVGLSHVHFDKENGLREKAVENSVILDNNNRDVNIATKKSLDDLSSIIDKRQRSNRCRYGTIIADLKTGLENPLFGVGTYNMRNLFIAKEIPSWAKDDAEVKVYLTHIAEHSENAANGHYPLFIALNEYAARFSMYGLVGLIVFLFPFCWVLYLVIKFLLRMREDGERKTIVLAGVIFLEVGLLLFDLNSRPVYSNFIFQIVLGLGFGCIDYFFMGKNFTSVER